MWKIKRKKNKEIGYMNLQNIVIANFTELIHEIQQEN